MGQIGEGTDENTGSIGMAHITYRFSDPEAWEQSCAGAIARELRAALDEPTRHVPVRLALAGGSTPEPILKRLAHEGLNWGRVSICPTDDRKVPDSDPARNLTAMTRSLQPVLRPHRPDGAIAEALEALPAGSAPDIVLLGFGNDRHIASLFPDGEGMEQGLDPTRTPGILGTVPRPLPSEAPFPRVTFNLSALLSARCVLIAAKGQQKAETLALALDEASARLSPLARLLSESRTPVHIYLLS